MGSEKHGSKGGGGYVGGLLQLFDWNAKSRKKLFSSKSDLSGTIIFHVNEDDELVAGSSIKGSSEYSCASSVTDEEGYGARAPGVVARLMGLDSLPTSNLAESFSTPFFDPPSLRDAHYHRRNLEFHHEHHHAMYSGNLKSKMEIPSQKTMEPKPQKTMNMPIEKFQTEILPPKSAKSIPVTHNKLLSPIKSPGFIPSKNAAHIMEAAAKIIDQGPQATTKAKMPLLGTSSVPFKVRGLKEKVEGAQKPFRLTEASGSRRPVESNAAKFLKGQTMGKSSNSMDSSDSEYCSGIKNDRKSVSLALQAKVNVQRREGLSPSGGSKSLFDQKEQGDIMSRLTFKSQPTSQKRMQKKPSAHSSSNVLVQNNQKQNCIINDKEKLPSKSLLSNSQGRKLQSGESSSVGRRKNSRKYVGNSKVGSRKLEPEVTDSIKEVSNSSTKHVPSKKRSIDGNFHLDKNRVFDTISVDKTENPTRSNSVVGRNFAWADDSKRKGSDVVSFTFTTPLSRPIPSRDISIQMPEKSNGPFTEEKDRNFLLHSDGSNSKKLSLLGHNAVGADALSILLERKLRELSHQSESSPCYRAGMTGNSASFIQGLIPTSGTVPTTSMYDNKKSQDGMHFDKLGGHYSTNFSSTGSVDFVTKLKIQVTEEMDECSGNDTEARKLLHYGHPSPISVLEPSSLSESCNSSDSVDSISTEGSKQCSSVQAQELVLGVSSSKKFEADAELSDSASSTSTTVISIKNRTHFVGSSPSWELEYVKEILFNVELMFKDFALGRAREIINPHLFGQLESRKEVQLESRGEERNLRRKVLFDCVSECMGLKCRTWVKGVSTLRRKECLAEEVYKEISGWGGMGDCMVDDLVDNDMSSRYGKWLDFEVESFEIGVEIEGRILSSLVSELVADILVS
ncbi:hypothetical protein U1Q18_015793 [Sarracenia purpurea var. burkii]